MNFSQLSWAWISTCVWFPLKITTNLPFGNFPTPSKVLQNHNLLHFIFTLMESYTLYVFFFLIRLNCNWTTNQPTTKWRHTISTNSVYVGMLVSQSSLPSFLLNWDTFPLRLLLLRHQQVFVQTVQFLPKTQSHGNFLLRYANFTLKLKIWPRQF